jgi:cystathionine beta-lyase/cystathionine gamma-synthase
MLLALAAMLGLVAAQQPVALSRSSDDAAAMAAAEADVADAKAAAASKELAYALTAGATTAAMSAGMAASAAAVADAFAPEKSVLAPDSLAVGAPVEKEGAPQPGDVVKYDEVKPGDHLKYSTGVYEGCFEDSQCFFDCPSG